MKRRLVLKVCLVFLVSGLFQGPTIGRATNKTLHAIQVSTLNKNDKPEKKKPQQPKKPVSAPAAKRETERTPEIPSDITLRIRLKAVASGNPTFALWSFRGGEFKETVLQEVRKVENEYLTKIKKGIDPTKKYWVRVDHEELSGEAMLQQPTRTGQELFLDVRMYPTVDAEITIADYDTHQPAIIYVGRADTPAQLLIPYEIDNEGRALFIKGMDENAQNVIYIEGFRSTAIEIGEIQNGHLKKKIALEPSNVPPENGGGKVNSSGGDGIWDILKFILAGISLASLVVLLSFGIYRLHCLRSQSPAPQIAVSSSRAQLAQPRRARTGSQHSPVTQESPKFIDSETGPDIDAEIDNSIESRPTEPQTLQVPFQLSEEGALQAYRSLIRRSALSRQPLRLDIMLSDSLNKKGEQLKETMDPSSKFILFTDGSERGWLFPNPAPAVRETNVEQTWQLLFEGLSKDEFERKMERLWPIKASRNNKGSKSLWHAQPQRRKFV